MKDLTYTNDGMFTRFYPNTPAGESAWRIMAEKNGGTAAFLNVVVPSVLYQLKAAGYTVGKEKKSKESIDDILAELGV